MGDQTYLAFMRVTILGMARSGKSSLVNNVVNNAFSASYTKTTEATLYYSVQRIQGEQDALLEIEDTFGSNDVGDVAVRHKHVEERQVQDFYDFWWPQSSTEARAAQKKLKDQGSTIDVHGHARAMEKPLGLYKPPVDGVFRPLTKNRMAFLIVFDGNDETSYKEAVRVFEGLKDYHVKKGSTIKPLINFVANKIDKDPTSPVFQGVMASAKAYCDFNSVPIQQVSALQYKGVKKLFRSIVQAVRSNQLLWLMDLDTMAEADDSEAGKCTIQ